MIKKSILSLLALLCTLAMKAQEPEAPAPQMADAFRDNGKIYVVITVIAIVFICLVGFLVFLERRLKKLEQELHNK